MGTPSAIEFDRIVNEEEQRKQTFSDAQRKDQIGQFMQTSNNLHKALALLTNPDTMQPLPGKEDQATQLRQHLSQVDSHIQSLYNPSFNPTTGETAVSPMRKLGDLLHITHPSEVNKTAGQQMKELGDIRSQYGETATPVIDTSTKHHDLEQEIAYKDKLLEKYGASPKTRQEIRESALGGAKPVTQKAKWDKIDGTIDGKPVTWLKNQSDGSLMDLAGNDIPDEQAVKFVATPKGQPPKPKEGWVQYEKGKYYSFLADPYTNQEVPGSRNYTKQPPSSIAGRLTEGFYHYYDPTTGNVISVPEKRSSVVLGSGGGSTPVAGGGAAQAPGLIQPGNIDLSNRPQIPNRETGGTSTVYSTSVNIDGKEVLLPRAADGKILSVPEAIARYKRTGEHLGIFDTPENATAYAQQLHQQEARRIQTPSRQGGGSSGAGAGRIIGNKGTKDLVDTKATYQSALDRQEIMHDNQQAAYGGDQQAMLSLVANHIGMTLGAQKGARINQAVWNEAVASADWFAQKASKFFHQDEDGNYVFDGWKAGVTLTKDQIDQMVHLADQKVEVLKHHVDRLNAERGASQNQGGGGGPKKKVSIAKAKLKPEYQGKADAEVKAAIEAHGYEAIP